MDEIRNFQIKFAIAICVTFIVTDGIFQPPQTGLEMILLPIAGVFIAFFSTGALTLFMAQTSLGMDLQRLILNGKGIRYIATVAYEEATDARAPSPTRKSPNEIAFETTTRLLREQNAPIAPPSEKS